MKTVSPFIPFHLNLRVTSFGTDAFVQPIRICMYEFVCISRIYDGDRLQSVSVVKQTVK